LALPEDKWFDNVTDKSIIKEKTYSFYCDWACIHCNLCQEAAPNHFKTSLPEDHNCDDFEICDHDHSFVFNQPKTEEELAACLEALEWCPVEAIGHDGHLSTDKKYKHE
jgi:ferredoxin